MEYGGISGRRPLEDGSARREMEETRVGQIVMRRFGEAEEKRSRWEADRKEQKEECAR